MLQHMGDVSAHITAAFLHYERKNEEVVMLTNVIAPPPRLFHYFNTFATHTCLSGKGEPTS